jgi:hypothetical protein
MERNKDNITIKINKRESQYVGSFHLQQNQGIISKQKVRDVNPVPTEKPGNKPPLAAAEINLPNASITITNNRGDRRSPCIKPR